MFKTLSAASLEELRTKVDEFIKDRPNAMVEYGHIAIITDTAGDVPDNVGLPLGSIVTFAAYPNIRWTVQHVDGDYVYLATETVVSKCAFGRDNAADIKYSESTLYAYCMLYLNDAIPDIANYLEDVTTNGVTTKVFVPSYEQLKLEWAWPEARASNRICQLDDYNKAYWTSTAYESSHVWYVDWEGFFVLSDRPTATLGFRPAIKLNLRNYLKVCPGGLQVDVQQRR